MNVMGSFYYLIGTTKPTGGPGLTYQTDAELPLGQLVEVTVRGRAMAGVVLEAVRKPNFTTQPIKRILELAPLPPQLIKLGGWLSDYYVADPAHCWQTILPSGLLKTRRPQAKADDPSKIQPPANLNIEQQRAVKAIQSDERTTTLLRGVTGSGKTEVYQALAARQLEQGRSSIILIPEIALTPQTEARFRQKFGSQVVITHSRLTEAQRHIVWAEALTSSKPLVVIGPRSALFMPLPSIGLIVIDECHETSYKQEQAPRFDALMAAGKLAHLHGAKLVLGSATPGLREAFLAERGLIHRVDITDTYNQIAASRPIIVDLKDPLEFRTNPVISRTLWQHLDESFRRGRGSLLFLNRRGSASSQICTNCQHVTACPNCQLPLVLHADQARMVCHICNYHTTPPAVCTKCGQAALRFLGIGTKRVEAELVKLFPSARIARLDKDSLTAGGIDQLYQALVNHEVDFLIGTQMVAKGLDLPQMETIGVILADTSLYLPDFSATERTFALLTQVSGRAGRGQHPGRTIIQTYSPTHPVIQALGQGDYWDFAAAELAERKLLAYPPYSYLLKLTCSHKTDQTAAETAAKLARQLQTIRQIEVIGPAPAFRQFAGGVSHWQIIVKSKLRARLQAIAANLPSGWTADLDPINLL